MALYAVHSSVMPPSLVLSRALVEDYFSGDDVEKEEATSMFQIYLECNASS